jgi:hypothetical protein
MMVTLVYRLDSMVNNLFFMLFGGNQLDYVNFKFIIFTTSQ